MLKGTMQLCFENQRTDTDFYDANRVKSCTFRFEEDIHYIGFLDAIDPVEKYYFYNTYLVSVMFPSIDEARFNVYSEEWKKNPKIQILLGSKIIGWAFLEEWSYAPDGWG